MSTFNSDLIDLVNSEQHSPQDLLALLKPMNQLIDNPAFSAHIAEIVAAVTEDRNGDKTFTLEDLELLATDLAAVGKLIKAIILLIVSAREVNMKYQEGVTEEIIRNIFVYIVLVLVPEATGRPWTTAEKEKIVVIIAKLHDMILASKIAENAFKKVIKWFQRRDLCMCCILENDPEDVIQQNLPALTTEIGASVNKNRILLQKYNN